MKSFEWTDATTVDHAVAQLAENPKAALKAGGVDLLDLMKEHLTEPPRLVNIRNVKDLNFLEDDDKNGLHIGPLVTLARLDADPAVRKRYAALAQACGKAATPQIRNMATVGGNLLQRPRCWYFRSEQFHCRKKGGEICYAQDGENQYHAIFNNKLCAIVHPSAAAVPLVAMGATIELTGSKGKRETKLEEFFVLPQEDVHRENRLGPDEMLTAIRVPAPAATVKSAYTKYGEKESFDWPLADVAVVLDMDGKACKSASIVLGAAAPIPWRAKDVEKALAGKEVNEENASAAARASMNGAEPLELNGYKVPVFEAIVRRTILAAAGLAPHQGEEQP